MVSNKRLCWGLIIFWIIGASQLAGQAKHPVTIDEMLAVKSVDWVELSPDAAQLVYTTGGEIWVISTGPGKANAPKRPALCQYFSLQTGPEGL